MKIDIKRHLQEKVYINITFIIVINFLLHFKLYIKTTYCFIASKF